MFTQFEHSCRASIGKYFYIRKLISSLQNTFADLKIRNKRFLIVSFNGKDWAFGKRD